MRKLAAVLAAVLLARCATSVHYDNLDFQEVPVTSTPSDAHVVVDCGRGPNSIGNTPVMLRLVRRDRHCSMVISKTGWIAQRIDFQHTIMPAALLDAATGALAAGLVQVAHVDFAASNGTSSGGTVSVSATGYGYVTPAVVGLVVFSTAMLVDAGSGALWSHSPARVHVELKPGAAATTPH